MKKTIQTFLFLLSFGVIAQQNSKPTDFIVLTTEINQLQPILLAADALASAGDFKIVFYGKNAADLQNIESKKFINWAANSNVKLSVCQMSLDALKINHNNIPEEIEIVDNAFLYALQLQKKEYKILNL